MPLPSDLSTLKAAADFAEAADLIRKAAERIERGCERAGAEYRARIRAIEGAESITPSLSNGLSSLSEMIFRQEGLRQ